MHAGRNNMSLSHHAAPTCTQAFFLPHVIPVRFPYSRCPIPRLLLSPPCMKAPGRCFRAPGVPECTFAPRPGASQGSSGAGCWRGTGKGTRTERCSRPFPLLLFAVILSAKYVLVSQSLQDWERARGGLDGKEELLGGIPKITG